VRWWVWDGNQIIAAAVAEIYEGIESNPHAADFEVDVLPSHRRQGLGSRLMKLVAEEVAAAGRTLLFTIASSSIPSGDAFLRHLGAEPGLEARVNQLAFEDLDLELIDEWVSIGEARSGEYELVWWDDAIPEESLDEVVDLLMVMNDAPRGDLELEDFEFSGENIRQNEAAVAARNIARWMVAVRHTESGRLAGFTEMYFNPTIPDLGQQNDTGVFPEHRGRGLGRLLKATMIRRVLEERPEIRRVRTGNATNNAPMLRINEELGFRELRVETIYQVAVDRVLEGA
jgi:mycothiol synthase